MIKPTIIHKDLSVYFFRDHMDELYRNTVENILPNYFVLDGCSVNLDLLSWLVELGLDSYRGFHLELPTLMALTL